MKTMAGEYNNTVTSNLPTFCVTKYDCSLPYQQCCNYHCVTDNNCFGNACSVDATCGFGEICCRGECRGNCDSPLQLILILAVGFVVLLCLIGLIVWFYKRKKATGGRSQPGRILANRIDDPPSYFGTYQANYGTVDHYHAPIQTGPRSANDLTSRRLVERYPQLYPVCGPNCDVPVRYNSLDELQQKEP